MGRLLEPPGFLIERKCHMAEIRTKEFAMTREEYIRVNTALLLRENAPAMIVTPTILVAVNAYHFWWLSV
jgi:hypothetical protein